MNDFWSIAGICVGIAGLVYAVYENHQRKKLAEIIRANNWFMYQRVNTSTGTIQLALKAYKEAHKNNIFPEVIEHISAAAAYGLEILRETIRQIQLSEPSFTQEDFERWRKENKLTDDKVEFFRKHSVDVKDK